MTKTQPKDSGPLSLGRHLHFVALLPRFAAASFMLRFRALWLFMLCASACATPVTPAKTEAAPAPSPAADLRHQSVSELERQELERPADAQLKLELARRSWCSGARGPAVEGWLWVRQFAASNAKAATEARQHIASARKDPDSLEDRLECGDIQSAERK